jgi:hypothetical protein
VRLTTRYRLLIQKFVAHIRGEDVVGKTDSTVRDPNPSGPKEPTCVFSELGMGNYP